MTIDKIKKVQSNDYNPIKKKNIERTDNSLSDNVHISESAQKKTYEIKLKAEAEKITKNIVNSTDTTLRQKKIEQVKQKLKSGFYDNLSMEVLNKTADEIINSLFDIKK